MPESNYFQVTKAEREARLLADKGIGGETGATKAQAFKAFLREAVRAFGRNWV